MFGGSNNCTIFANEQKRKINDMKWYNRWEYLICLMVLFMVLFPIAIIYTPPPFLEYIAFLIVVPIYLIISLFILLKSN
jgi:hypothetical protein